MMRVKRRRSSTNFWIVLGDLSLKDSRMVVQATKLWGFQNGRLSQSNEPWLWLCLILGYITNKSLRGNIFVMINSWISGISG